MHRAADGRAVVVGVDGSPEGTEALRYGAATAQLRGMWLLVVHAYELPPHAATVTAAALAAAALAAAHRVIADALSAVTLPAGLQVEAAVALMTPVLTLQQLSGQAAMIVLGQHADEPSHPFPAGPVTSPVAAVSSCPVVIVPLGWSRQATTVRAVVVALDSRPGAAAVVGYAFAEAERRRWPLLALHALPVGVAALRAAVESEHLGQLLRGPRHDHPDVQASAVVVQGDLAQVVLGAARSARLLVVGRPSRHSRPGVWPHATTREVTTRLRCPLVVVPPREVEATGKLQRS